MNWSFTDTCHYLEVGHGIKEKRVAEEIFKISNGYPLVTYYLASQYCKSRTLPKIGTITEVNDYYRNLIVNVDFKRFSPFIVLSPFFTNDDMVYVVDDSLCREFIHDFVETYPFLFEKKFNRVALFHDSFTSFLANNANRNPVFEKTIVDKIGESVLGGSDRFLSRFGNIVTDSSIIEMALLKYSSFEEFEKILSFTEDWESIFDFYSDLKLKLEHYPELFGIKEYYNFILITQIIERDLFFDFDIMYYHILHLIKNGKNENSIHSNGIMWSMYQIVTKIDYRDYVEHLRKRYYDTHNIISKNNFFIEWQDVEISCRNEEHLLKNQWGELEYDYASRYFVTKYLSDDNTDGMTRAVSDLLQNAPGSRQKSLQSPEILVSVNIPAISFQIT